MSAPLFHGRETFMSNRWTIFALGGAALLSSACNSSGIEGDWYTCSTSACSEYEADAMRFRDDGTFVGLTDRNGLTCEMRGPRDNGTYEYDEDRGDGLLTMRPFSGSTYSFTFAIDGERATYRGTNGTFLFQRYDSEEFSLCAEGITA